MVNVQWSMFNEMKQFIAFVIKEAKHILRDKRTMLILFGMPVVMMLLFGFAISTDVKNVRTVVVTSHMSPRIQQAVERLAHSEYFIITQTVNTPQQAEQLMRSQQVDMALVFDKDQGLQFMVDGSDPNMAQQWTTYAQQTLASENPKLSTLNSQLLYNPQMRSAYNFVPAIMGMLLILICAMMTSISIVREKEKGTMEVLLVSPVRPLMVIVAKAVPYLVLAFGILITILFMSRYVLGVPIAGSLLSILAVSTLYILLALSLGLLISNVAQTQLVALLMSAMVLLMPVVMLSGMIFPVESMPQVLQWLAALVPPRYYIEAMRKEYSDDAFRLAVFQIGGTDLDIISSTVAVQNLCLVCAKAKGAGLLDIKWILDELYGESSNNSMTAERILSQLQKLNIN